LALVCFHFAFPLSEFTSSLRQPFGLREGVRPDMTASFLAVFAVPSKETGGHLLPKKASKMQAMISRCSVLQVFLAFIRST
jgi:hypothetical protein